MADEMAESFGDQARDIPGVPVIDHQLIRLIGRGSYGEVWLAKNALGTFRAVKIVYEKTFRDKRPFEREFNGVQKFEPISRLHEGLMDILQVGRNDAAGYFYCVMELADDAVSGQDIDPQKYSPRTLAHDLAARRRLPIEECLQSGLAIASALEFLHARGLVHRDVKPTNVVFVNGIPKLADIGLVAELSQARSYVGTDGFIPPEGPGTVQADIYSFGKVLYEISTGKDRHDYPQPATLIGDPAHEKGLIEFNKIVLRACRADPAERYASADQLRADLAALQCGEPLPSERISKKLSRKVKIAALLAGSLAATGLLLLNPRIRSGVANRFHFPVESSAVVAPPGLVGWWRAEDNGEDSAGTNHASLYGVGFIKGKVGRAFDFLPSWHRMYVPDSDDFKLTNSLTIEGWIFVRTLSRQGQYIFIRGDSRPGWDPYGFCVVSGKLDFNMTQSSSNYVNLQAPISQNEWKHVAATWEGSTGEMRIYVDGVLAARTNTTVRPFADLEPTGDPSIGIGNVGPFHQNFCFNGMIDEIALYSRALSPSEIESIYRAGSKGKRLAGPARRPRPAAEETRVLPPAAPVPSGLIAWWPGEKSAVDIAGQNDGKLRNGVTFAPGKVGMAFQFSSNSFVEIPRAPCFNLTNEGTVEFWMKADLDNPMNDCCQGLVSSDFYAVEISGTVDPYGLNFSVVNASGPPSMNTSDPILGSAVISSGEWHHIGATFDGKVLCLYVDGKLWRKPASYVGPIPPMLTNSFVAIGSEDGRTFCGDCASNRYFKGLIDEVSIYDRALSALEIAAIYQAGSAGKVAEPHLTRAR